MTRPEGISRRGLVAGAAAAAGALAVDKAAPASAQQGATYFVIATIDKVSPNFGQLVVVTTGAVISADGTFTTGANSAVLVPAGSSNREIRTIIVSSTYDEVIARI